MDRPLDEQVRKRNVTRRGAVVVAASATLLLALGGARTLLRPGVRRADVRIARVDSGPVEAVTTAAGTVLPELEQAITSPVDARVVSILRRAGSPLAPGDAIVELDANDARLSLAKLERAIAVKRNQRLEESLALETRLSALRGQVDVKRLQLEAYSASRARNEKLFAEGLLSEDGLRQARLDEERTKLELTQLAESEALARRSAETSERSHALELESLESEGEDAARTVRLTTARSDRRGVLTYVTPELGAAVRRGDVLARVADLSRFRVEATLSDVHAQRLSAGLPVRVVANDAVLTGRVASVLPTVKNGALTLEVALDEPSHPALRPSLRVDVHVVTGRKEHALRLARGSLVGTGAAPEVFVVRGTRAVRTPVRFGLAGNDLYEVVEGLSEGDEVIVSGASDLTHARQIAIR